MAVGVVMMSMAAFRFSLHSVNSAQRAFAHECPLQHLRLQQLEAVLQHVVHGGPVGGEIDGEIAQFLLRFD
ncbi:hypothetical protein [Azorhizobium sp. AG788]|uniref:hypothetical protein n=1 Tax=Azorhizobium sp. AG788 TaxID=2183897 RepID=UPI0031390DF1